LKDTDVVGGTAQAPRVDRRTALVRAAFNRLAERGFEGLRLRDVAAEAGIDHSTLHHYFPTKEYLVAAVVDDATRQFWSARPPGDGPDDLGHHLRMLAGMLAERPELFVVLRELDLRATRDAAVRAIVDERERGWRRALVERLRRCGPAGPPDPAAGAELIIATVKGLSFRPGTAPAVLAQLERLLCPGEAHP
jgi:AcrR family transcriptional regulator